MLSTPTDTLQLMLDAIRVLAKIEIPAKLALPA